MTLREKKTYGYGERNEEKRQAFKEQIAIKPRPDRIYVDESGMDNRDEYAYGWNERGQRFHALKSGKRQGRVKRSAF